MLSLEEQNRWRQHYQAQRPSWRPATVVFAATVREYLAPEKRLLDVGCGRGGLVEQLHHPLAQTVGVDPDWDSLREHRLASLPRLAGASEALALASAAVDVAFGSWIMEHLAEPEQTLREIRRVLVPGGVFVFITPNGAHPLALVNRLLGRLGRWQGTLVERFYGRAGADAFPTFYRANTPAQLRALAAGAGLRLERLEAVGDPTYLLFHPALFNPLVRLEESLPPGRQIHLVGVYRRRVCVADSAQRSRIRTIVDKITVMMENVSLLKRMYYRYIGYIFWLAYRTTQRRVLGVRIRTLIRWASLLLPLVALWQGWGMPALVVSLLIFLWVQWTYWRARRAGYFRFVAAGEQAIPEGELEILPPYERIPLRATGSFSVKEYDKNVLLQAAEYWQVPLGEHAVMVEHAPGKYVYQFFSAETLRQIQQGWLLHGPRAHAALAVSFLSNWQAQADTDQVRFFGDAPPAGALHTIYFSFDSLQDERSVWHNIVHDARRVRS